MTAADLERFISNAAPGEKATYYVGHLVVDRARDPYVDHAATYAADHSDGSRFLMSECHHSRTMVIGSGELRLAQARVDDAVYAYDVIRR
jgi:hypothetical protein